MAQKIVKIDSEGTLMKVCILTRGDIHPLYKIGKGVSFDDVRLSDFIASSLSADQINKSGLIFYKEDNKIKILKNKYNL